MSNNKQTAVEWLVEEIHKNVGWIPVHIQEQAKEMEKEQIMDAYKADLYPCSDEDAEDYYKQTFKSE